MSDWNVQVVTLEPMRMASAWAFGEEPEHDAWRKMDGWARPLGLLGAESKGRAFGFNNPNPSEGTRNHGYEYWLSIGPAAQPAGDIQVKEFEGGLYAVAPCTVTTDPWVDIPGAWARLDAWVHENGRELGAHQWLEEHTLDGHIKAIFYPLAG